MSNKSTIVSSYARMWPREVFDRLTKDGRSNQTLARDLDILKSPGIYILYQDGVPYYIGKSTKLRRRLWDHAWNPKSRYYNLWNYFSFFVVENPYQMNELEGILIAAMPTANGSRPRMNKERLDPRITKMLREIRISRANPNR